MRRLVRLVQLEIWRQVVGWSGTWWFVITLIAGQAVAPLLGLFVWVHIPSAGPAIGSYYVAATCAALMTASFENHTFANAIYSGDVSDALLRPQPTVIGPLGENLAIRLWMTILGIPLIAAATLIVGAHFSVGAIVVALPALVLAATSRFLFTWMLAVAAFWTERVHALVAFGTVLIALLGGSAAPNDLLPEPLQTIAQILPFRSMLGFPAELAAGTLSAGESFVGYLTALVWTLVLGAAAIAMWRAGLRRYSTVGA